MEKCHLFCECVHRPEMLPQGYMAGPNTISPPLKEEEEGVYVHGLSAFEMLLFLFLSALFVYSLLPQLSLRCWLLLCVSVILFSSLAK